MYHTITFLLFVLCLLLDCNSRERQNINTSAISEGITIDSLVVFKSRRTLTVFSKTKEIKTFLIALGKEPVGRKQFEGDMKTPEGIYHIDAKSALSKYHKNLNISYPNTADKKYAASQNRRAGGEIKIHGLPNGYDEATYIRNDWTLGCIGLTNTEIDELYEHIKLGSPIHILP